MSLFSASRISSRGLIPTTYGGGGVGIGVAVGCAGGGGETTCVFTTIFVGTSIARLTAERTAGFGCGSVIGSLDALDVASARSIFSADFLASPGVGTGVEQVSATFPQLLAGVAMELMARGGGGGGTKALVMAGLIKGSSRRTMGAGGGGSAGGGAETRVGGMVGHTIGLPISKARPLGV